MLCKDIITQRNAAMMRLCEMNSTQLLGIAMSLVLYRRNCDERQTILSYREAEALNVGSLQRCGIRMNIAAEARAAAAAAMAAEVMTATGIAVKLDSPTYSTTA